MRVKIYKKAQGLPINTIILAVLGIAIMVLIFAAVTGRLGGFIRATSECNGRCTPYETLPSPYAAESREGCVQGIEVEDSSYSYVQRGTKGSSLPKRCDACCMRLV